LSGWNLLCFRSDELFDLHCGILSNKHRPIKLHELLVWLFFNGIRSYDDLHFDLRSGNIFYGRIDFMYHLSCWLFFRYD